MKIKKKPDNTIEINLYAGEQQVKNSEIYFRQFKTK